MLIYGQDVSNYQRSYAWPGGLHFGIAKATEGTGFRDAYFAHNWSALAAKGYVRGAYHFAHPKNDPTTEAKYFLATVRAQGLKAGDLLALDLEDADGQSGAHVAAWAKTWLAYVEKQTGRRPLLYTYRSFAATYCAGLGAYPLWIADPTTAGKPRLARPWHDWAIHQYSTAGGIDHDCTRLTAAQLRALGSGTTPQEDDVPQYISLGTKKPITGKKGQSISVEWDKVYAGKKGDGIIPAAPASATVEVTGGVPHELYTKDEHGDEHGLGGHETAVVELFTGDRLYCRLKFDRDATVTPYVKAHYFPK